MKIIRPISEMEKTLFKADPDREFTPVEYTKPHGFLRCRDDRGQIYILHPESLGLEANEFKEEKTNESNK